MGERLNVLRIANDGAIHGDGYTSGSADNAAIVTGDLTVPRWFHASVSLCMTDLEMRLCVTYWAGTTV